MRSGAVGVIVAVMGRPSLWPTAVVMASRMAPDGWWRRRPYLPLPDRRLLEFRASTQYGDQDHDLNSADVVAWLEWCRAENRRRRSN